MRSELPDEQMAALRVRATAQGVSAEQYVCEVLNENLMTEKSSSGVKQVRSPISEVIAEIMADTPPEEVEKLPEDGASEHDHYIYGWPKRKH